MKKLLYPSLILNFLLIAFFIGKRIYYSNSGQESKTETESWADMWNRGRTDVLSHSKIDTSSVVFIGDSITEGFLVTEIFGPKAKNQGISANTTRHILLRLEPIINLRPKKIVLNIGVNDLREDVPQDTIVDNFRRILMRIRNGSPKTDIIVNSVFPTSGDYFFVQPKILTLNESIKAYCQEQGFTFVDVYSDLVKNNQLDSSFTYDGIHLNGKGYKVWAVKIASFL